MRTSSSGFAKRSRTRQRMSASASARLSGRLSKPRTTVRTAPSGTSRPTLAPPCPTTAATASTAWATSSRASTLGRLNETRRAAGRNSRTARRRKELQPSNRAPATNPRSISITAAGKAKPAVVISLFRPNQDLIFDHFMVPAIRGRGAARPAPNRHRELLDKGHLVNFLERRHAQANFFQRRLAQRDHPLLARQMPDVV